VLVFLFSAIAGSTAAGSAPAACVSEATRERDGMRWAHRCVSTSDPRAQDAFDDGLTLLYAFNPTEARRAFQRAARADDGLALAWWGIAQTYAPNINGSYDSADARHGRDAIARAQSRVARATPVERALVEAARQRFAAVGSADGDRDARAYRDAMAHVADAHADDDDAAVLAAEAEMDVHQWSYFEPNGSPTAGTPGLIARLQSVLARTPEHIGAAHLTIHAYEESTHPERALAAADRLAGDRFTPAAEHLTHMPAHTYMRVGAYHAAGDANARAVTDYLHYFASRHEGHEDYFRHDCVFGVDAYMMSGERGPARALAEACARDGSQFGAIIALRFGDWAALARDAGANDFARGMSFAHDGRLALANERLHTLHASHATLAAIEADVLEGRIARTSGAHDRELAALERAVALQDGFGYAEPPTFWYPVRETLGAAFLRAGRLADAERVFRIALERDREDPRALFGLAETLARANRTSDAASVRERFERAWQQAGSELALKDL